MSRFRVWNKKVERFVDAAIDDQGLVLIYDYHHDIGKSWDFTEKQYEFIVQYFTGQKDRIGKDVFEGDILSMDYNKYASAAECRIPISEQFGEMKSVVKLENGCFVIDPPRPSTMGSPNKSLSSVCGIIVGNIFENSGLLK